MSNTTYLNELKEINSFFNPRVSNDAFMESFYGSNYLGRSQIKCDYCKEEAVNFVSFSSKHVCPDCREGLNELVQNM